MFVQGGLSPDEVKMDSTFFKAAVYRAPDILKAQGSPALINKFSSIAMLTIEIADIIKTDIRRAKRLFVEHSLCEIITDRPFNNSGVTN
jgi:hypothetical protein